MNLQRRACDTCHRDRQISDRAWHANLQRTAGQYVCRWCRWCKVTASSTYQATRSIDFGANPHSHTVEANAKRAVSQRGKFGENANAWKGGKRSLNSMVKAAVYRRHGWQNEIFKRDRWTCTACDSTKHLDAHHVQPFSVLLKSIKQPFGLVGDDLINWLADHPVLTEAVGITLGRPCHKIAHKNWGSHYAESYT